jgi:methylated-DNA-[protein]-cysteine S-methyltransferase
MTAVRRSNEYERIVIMRHAIIDSPVGELTLVGDEAGLTGVYFAEHARRPESAGFGEREDDGFDAPRQQFVEYFAGERSAFDLELAPHGNPFQLRVWNELQKIPYGETRTYGELAIALGDANLARAVGSANARNPLSIVVPCHRVIASNGALTGYAGGMARKAYLLELEAPASRTADLLF